MGGGHMLPDGFVMAGCASNLDCDDANPCTDDRCEPASQSCSSTPKSCAGMSDACNAGVCDDKDGVCKKKPAHDGKTCTTPGDFGQCLMGVCSPIPQCEPGLTTLFCAKGQPSRVGSTWGTSGIGAYTCAGATGLTGPEYAYPLKVNASRDVTLTLTHATVDLDLVVLEGRACTAAAKCVAAALTAGSGAETATFHAVAGTDYLVVVDGRSGASGSYTIEVGCSDTCKPIKTLDCNQSVMGDTTGTTATHVISSYDCNPSAPGPEDVYLVAPTAEGETEYQVKLKGMTTDLDMMVTVEDSGDCDPTSCEASATKTGTSDEEVSWFGLRPSVYYLMIDSKVAGQGGPYLLEVTCSASEEIR